MIVDSTYSITLQIHMATIALSGTPFGYSLGMNAFDSLGSAFTSSKKTTGDLQKSLSTLKSKIDMASVAAKTDSSQENVQKAQVREGTKCSSLSVAYDKLDALICDVGKVDQRVSGRISEREDDFYKEYSYLKPDCKKSKKERRHEKWAEMRQNFKDFWCGVGSAIINIAKSVGDWCKEHWKELLIGLAFIVVGALITVFTAGAGTAFWAAFGAAFAKGLAMAALSAAIGGSVSAGCTYYQCRKAGLSPEMSLNYAKKAFGDGVANGFMTGGIGFAVGAGVVGILGKGVLIGKSFGTSILKGAAFGAGTNAITSPVSTAISYWLKNGTLKGSGDTIIQSTISGVISGAVFGAVMGGAQFKHTEHLDNLAAKKASEQTNISDKGKIWSDHSTQRLKTTYPDEKLGTEISLKNDSINSQNGIKIGNRMDATLGSKNTNGSYKIGLFEFKATERAPTTDIQNLYWANNNNSLAGDVYMTPKGIGLYGNITIPQGTTVNVVRPSTIMQTIGMRVNPAVIIVGNSALTPLRKMFTDLIVGETK